MRALVAVLMLAVVLAGCGRLDRLSDDADSERAVSTSILEDTTEPEMTDTTEPEMTDTTQPEMTELDEEAVAELEETLDEIESLLSDTESMLDEDLTALP